MRFTIQNACWITFCIACLLAIWLGNRPQPYRASSLTETLGPSLYGNIAKEIESTAFRGGGGISGSMSPSTRMSGEFELFGSEEFDVTAFLAECHAKTDLQIRQVASLSMSDPIATPEQAVGFHSDWQTKDNFGLVELVYIGARDDPIKNHPEWSKRYSFRILIVEHKR